MNTDGTALETARPVAAEQRTNQPYDVSLQLSAQSVSESLPFVPEALHTYYDSALLGIVSRARQHTIGAVITWPTPHTAVCDCLLRVLFLLGLP